MELDVCGRPLFTNPVTFYENEQLKKLSNSSPSVGNNFSKADFQNEDNISDLDSSCQEG